MLELINTILDLALIESGKLSLSMEPVSLAELMFNYHTMIQPQAKSSGISLQFPQTEILYFVNADRTRLKQVMINLLSNAIKHNSPDLRLLTATDAMTDIKLARAAQPDIILTGINLPGINGIQALQILAKDPLTSHIPVIAVNANAIPSDIEKGLETGFFCYLTKPINININIFINTLIWCWNLLRPKRIN